MTRVLENNGKYRLQIGRSKVELSSEDDIETAKKIIAFEQKLLLRNYSKKADINKEQEKTIRRLLTAYSVGECGAGELVLYLGETGRHNNREQTIKVEIDKLGKIEEVYL